MADRDDERGTVPESVREVLSRADAWVQADPGDEEHDDLWSAVLAWQDAGRPGLDTDPQPSEQASGGERVDVALLREVAKPECAHFAEAPKEYGGTCSGAGMDVHEYCAPCLARRVLGEDAAAPGSDHVTHAELDERLTDDGIWRVNEAGPMDRLDEQADDVRELRERVEGLERRVGTLDEYARTDGKVLVDAACGATPDILCKYCGFPTGSSDCQRAHP